MLFPNRQLAGGTRSSEALALSLLALLLLLITPAYAQNFTGNSAGIVSNDAHIYPAQVQIGGSATVGSFVTITVSIGGNPHKFSYTAHDGDTLSSVIAALTNAITNDAAMREFGISADQGNPTNPAVGINPQRNGTPIPLVSTTYGGDLTSAVTVPAFNILDAGPVFYCNRFVPGQSPQQGDTVCSMVFGGPDSVTRNGATVQYGNITAVIANPDPEHPAGEMNFNTACENAVQGFLCGRLQIRDGIIVLGTSGLPTGGSMGPGTVNAPNGYYLNGTPLHEQGSWSPVLMGSTTAGDPSYFSSNAGTYECELNSCTARFTLAVSNLGGASGYAQIAGFPLGGSADHAVGTCSIAQMSGVRMEKDYTILGAQIGPGASTASLVQSGSGVISQGLLTTAFNAGWVVIQGTCSYRASSDGRHTRTPHVVGAEIGTHDYR